MVESKPTRRARILPMFLLGMLVVQLLPADLSPLQPAAAAPAPFSTQFGATGSPRFATYNGPAQSAQEPGIGVAWGLPGGISPSGAPEVGTTAMYGSNTRQYRLDFNDAVTPPSLIGGWTDVTDPNNAASVINFDPILFTEFRTGRTFAGGWIDPVILPGLAAGPPVPIVAATGCAWMMFSDDNGASWTQMTDTCSLPAADHPTLGAGPVPAGYQRRAGGCAAWDLVFASPACPAPAVPVPSPTLANILVYYCAQGGAGTAVTFRGITSNNSCSVSEDGGLTFLPGGNIDDGLICQTFNGHLRVGPDGTAYLPHVNCSGLTAVIVSEDGGQSWSVRTLNFPNSGTSDFDPSVAPTLDSGWIYFGAAELDCACIALSKDGGLTWEDVGQGNGAPPGTKYFNVGANAYDQNGNPVTLRRFNFADVIAGDDDRASFAFLGATGTDVRSNCAANLEWHLYVSQTFDEGKTWTTVRASSDPVQRGGIWNGGGAPACGHRNMLDFMDIASDAYGRTLVGYTDGCANPCSVPLGGQSTQAISVVSRQYTGCGLLKRFDQVPGQCIIPPGTFPSPDCDPTETPVITIEAPAEGDIIDADSLTMYGTVDRQRVTPAIYAETHGPYYGITNMPITIQGSAFCGSGSFDCMWTGLTGSPRFASASQCRTHAFYPAPGTYTLELAVTDRQSGYTSTDTTLVTVRNQPPGGGGGGGGTPPPPPPPPPNPMKCVDTSSIGPEPDNDAFLDVAGAGVGTNFNGVRAEAPWEIRDLCGQVTSTQIMAQMEVDVWYYNPAIYTDQTGAVLYRFIIDGNIFEVCNALGTATIYDWTSNGYTTAGTATIDPATGLVTLSMNLPNPLLTMNPHRISGETWEGECQTSLGSPTIGGESDRVPNSGTPMNLAGPSPVQAPVTSPVTVGTPGTLAATQTIGAALGGGVSTLVPAIGNLAVGTAQGAVATGDRVLSGANQGTGLSSTVTGTVSQAANTVDGIAGNAPGPVGSTVDGATDQVEALAHQVVSLNLGSIFALLGLQTPGATQAAGGLPMTPVTSTPVSAEYVRITFDWGQVLYQPVSTLGPIDHDAWGFVLEGLTSDLNGPHVAKAAWFDGSGAALDEAWVNFTIGLSPEGMPEAEAPAPHEPDSGSDGTLANVDTDGDGLLDGVDNCVRKPNPKQEDLDGDGAGDACDPDVDADGIPNGIDNCPVNPNPDQAITHFPNPKGLGDACNKDWDGDGVANALDICPDIANPKQEDEDNDRVGDVCEASVLAQLYGNGANSGAMASQAPGPRDSVTIVAPEADKPFSLGSADLYGMLAGFLLVAVLALAMIRRKR